MKVINNLFAIWVILWATVGTLMTWHFGLNTGGLHKAIFMSGVYFVTMSIATLAWYMVALFAVRFIVWFKALPTPYATHS
jgi:hypothetical protein